MTQSLVARCNMNHALITKVSILCRRFRVLQLGLRGAPDDESAEDLRAEDTVDLRGLL